MGEKVAFFENGKKCSKKWHLLRCSCFKNGKILYDIFCSTCTPVSVVDFDHFYNGKVSKPTFGNATFRYSPFIQFVQICANFCRAAFSIFPVRSICFGINIRKFLLWLRATHAPASEWPQPALVSERSKAG